MIENESVAPDCPLRHTARITLALSNLCPYRHLHPKCPASKVTDPQILPEHVVRDVLTTAARWGWGESGVIAWHTYNEPTADPRLILFCGVAKRLMPKIQIHIWTNGWYLDHGMALEMMEAGVTHLVVSTYSEAEFARLSPLRQSLKRYPINVKVWRQSLDDRMLPLEGEPRHSPCQCPLYDLTIYATGQIGLCCMDWRKEVAFGDLNTTSFAAAMARAFPEMVRLEQQLERRDRQLGVCCTCRMRRGAARYPAGRKKAIDKPAGIRDTETEDR